MPRFLTLVIFGGLVWYGWSRYQEQRLESQTFQTSQQVANRQPALADMPRATSSGFSCDGRTHCSQMTSCAEATYFIRNCPNTQMDGDNDGEPCESQWCK